MAEESNTSFSVDMRKLLRLLPLLALLAIARADGEIPSCGSERDPLLPVVVGKLWGYADMSGSIVIQPKFRRALPFSANGLAWVVLDGTSFISFDHSNVVNEPEGIAFEVNYGGTGFTWSCIDRSGNIVFHCEYPTIKPFFIDGLCPVFSGSEYFGGGWGYCDSTGKLVIPGKFAKAGYFSNGRALVSFQKEFSKYGYIDRTGRMIVEPKLEDARRFSEGLAAVEVDGKWGFIDTTEKFVIQPKFLGAGEFSEGLAWATVKDKAGYIDRTGKFIIPPKFASVGRFSEGLVRTDVKKKFGFIDRRGVFAIPATFEHKQVSGFDFDFRINDFSCGRAPVMIGDKYGYIDTSGTMVIAPTFTDAFSFHQGAALVRDGDAWAYIDITGRVIWSTESPSPR
ncbi:MAG: WG repeat-containing protein [Candidatus Kapaibacterium sp.]